jgi:hypothetical protein
LVAATLVASELVDSGGSSLGGYTLLTNLGMNKKAARHNARMMIDLRSMKLMTGLTCDR